MRTGVPASLPGDRVRLAGRITLWAVGGFLILFVVAAAWVGVRGAIAAYHLAQIRADAADVVSTLAADPAGALVRLNDLGEHTRAAQELTSDPVWSSFEVVPWVGPQLSAAQTVSASADELLRQGVLPLAEASQGVSMNALKPVDGRIDFGALETIEEPAQRAAARADSALRAVEGIDRTPLLGRLSDSVDQVEDVFSRAAGALDALSRATQILPGMLGESGPRTYLVLVQNNAEFRSLGGIAGTTLLLQTDHGSVSLVGTETGSALSTGIVEPVIELPHDVQDIYGTRPARFFQNVTQIPDFTLDGPLARDIYLRQTGKDVDGVLAVDPVVLSYLLKATGPVTLPDGETIKADNATSLFLRDVYQRFPNTSDQDAFFAASSASIFSAFLAGRGSSASILSALARGVDERRVMLWSAHADEQQLIAGSSLAGELPRTDDDTARFGVFFNDGGGSKMSYYVKPDVSVAWSGCAIPGQDVPRQLTLSVSLSNTAAADAATTLPTYVTANGWFGIAPGTAAIVGNIYLPSGYTLVSAQASNGASFTNDALQGRDVLSYGLNLPPQTEETIIVVVETPSSARTAEAIVTPTADSSITPLVSSTCDLARNPSLN